MAQAGETPTLVVLVFDPSNGKVSVNGEQWLPFRLARLTDKPRKSQEKAPTKPTPYTFPPPGEGDDTLECLPCPTHSVCHLFVWTGSRWVDLGAGCTGPFCP